jgi:hypothetical protein
MDNLERVRRALERVVRGRVKVETREEWIRRLQAGGKPTVLDEPLDSYRGAWESPGFQSMTASGNSHAPEGGLHIVRNDDREPPERRVKTYSDHIIEDLVGDPRWSEVLRISELEDSADLHTLVRAHVFGYLRLRDDHWSSDVPPDIARATPKRGPQGA